MTTETLEAALKEAGRAAPEAVALEVILAAHAVWFGDQALALRKSGELDLFQERALRKVAGYAVACRRSRLRLVVETYGMLDDLLRELLLSVLEELEAVTAAPKSSEARFVQLVIAKHRKVLAEVVVSA